MARAKSPLVSLEVEGNNGGSYVRMTVSEDREGFVQLEVGETCVVTVRREIPVSWLAVILTKAHDDGFENVLRAYGCDDKFIKAAV